MTRKQDRDIQAHRCCTATILFPDTLCVVLTRTHARSLIKAHCSSPNSLHNSVLQRINQFITLVGTTPMPESNFLKTTCNLRYLVIAVSLARRPILQGSLGITIGLEPMTHTAWILLVCCSNQLSYVTLFLTFSINTKGLLYY